MRTETGNIQSTRESESLKSVLLDAITHDFKSPLTSIKALVSGLSRLMYSIATHKKLEAIAKEKQLFA